MGNNDCSRCGGWPNFGGHRSIAYCQCTEADERCDDLEAEIERLKAEVEKARRLGVIEGFNAARIISASETTHHYLYQTPDDYFSSLQPKAEGKV